MAIKLDEFSQILKGERNYIFSFINSSRNDENIDVFDLIDWFSEHVVFVLKKVGQDAIYTTEDKAIIVWVSGIAVIVSIGRKHSSLAMLFKLRWTN